MGYLPALPDPEQINELALTDTCGSILAWAEESVDYAEVRDMADKLKVFADYVAAKQARKSEILQGTLLALKVRCGELLPKPRPGKRTDLQPPARSPEVKIDESEAKRLRKLAEHKPVVEELVKRSIADAADPDLLDADKLGPVSEAMALRAIENFKAGRPICDVPPARIGALCASASSKLREALKLAPEIDFIDDEQRARTRRALARIIKAADMLDMWLADGNIDENELANLLIGETGQ